MSAIGWEKTRGKKAWLVTWEWAGEHARRENPIAAFFRPQLSGARVRELVEFIYLSEYTPGDRLYFTPGRNPYRAEFGKLAGVSWQGEIICGHNPWLRARLVDDLLIYRGEDGKEKAVWNERAKPDVSWGC